MYFMISSIKEKNYRKASFVQIKANFVQIKKEKNMVIYKTTNNMN